VTQQPGDIGLVSIAGNVGRLIRLGQWLLGDGYRNYEHSFVAVDADNIVEAETGGAVLVPLHYDAVLWLRCPPEYGLAVACAARRMVGTPYSFADYFALAAVRLHLPSKRLRRYVTDSGHEICSQLADAAASRGGWHLFTDGRLPQAVTPGDLTALAVKAAH
jgi:hypothetical protein